MLVALDDTDSQEGGCTTHQIFRILVELPELALRGFPRLIRLNPNVPWKTRGNGAVTFELCKPTGPSAVVGELHGREIHAFPDGAPVPATAEILERIWRVVRRHAENDAAPGVAIWDARPPRWTYDLAVTETLQPGVFKAVMPPFYHAAWDARALIGCTAAAAWTPGNRSFEFIAYRMEGNFGKPRKIDPAAFADLDASGVTFHTFAGDKFRAAPNTLCPVLLGLRGLDSERLMDRARRATHAGAQEPIAGWLLFETNQASGDHLVPVESIMDAAPGMNPVLQLTVGDKPTTIEGGHVFLEAIDEMDMVVRLAAFEPTKELRDPVRGLAPGDKIRVAGSWNGKLLAIEFFEITHVADVFSRGAAPACPKCAKQMKSIGTNAGYRCKSCSEKLVEPPKTLMPRSIGLGWHEAPISARRHLHRPLSWGEPTFNSKPVLV